tara:strand:- start:343 stop:591 length:249 start_codon:yes stop_codon:yes gene_type:complete
MTETTTPETEAVAETQDQPVQLGMADLQACIQIIDVATTRGAFRGEELSAVGGARDRISAFIESNKPAEEEPTEQSGDADAE